MRNGCIYNIQCFLIMFVDIVKKYDLTHVDIFVVWLSAILLVLQWFMIMSYILYDNIFFNLKTVVIVDIISAFTTGLSIILAKMLQSNTKKQSNVPDIIYISLLFFMFVYFEVPLYCRNQLIFNILVIFYSKFLIFIVLPVISFVYFFNR